MLALGLRYLARPARVAVALDESPIKVISL
jgi:hypothetical protein